MACLDPEERIYSVKSVDELDEIAREEIEADKKEMMEKGRHKKSSISNEIIINSAIQLYEQGEKCMSIGDNERAYLAFVRFLKEMQTIMDSKLYKSHFYKKDRQRYDYFLGQEARSRTIENLNKLRDKLSEEYLSKNKDQIESNQLIPPAETTSTSKDLSPDLSPDLTHKTSKIYKTHEKVSRLNLTLFKHELKRQEPRKGQEQGKEQYPAFHKSIPTPSVNMTLPVILNQSSYLKLKSSQNTIKKKSNSSPNWFPSQSETKDNIDPEQDQSMISEMNERVENYLTGYKTLISPNLVGKTLKNISKYRKSNDELSANQTVSEHS